MSFFTFQSRYALTRKSKKSDSDDNAIDDIGGSEVIYCTKTDLRCLIISDLNTVYHSSTLYAIRGAGISNN